MFRPMRRNRQQVSDEECRRVLREEARAALAVAGDDGYPYAVPVNFLFDEEDGCLYVHGARTGKKMDSLAQDNRVCVTVWDQGFKREGRWEWNVTSVVVLGRAEMVEDREVLLDRLRRLAEKYYPCADEVEAEMASPAVERVCLLRIRPEHITGKLVNER